MAVRTRIDRRRRSPAWTETEDPSYRFGSVRIDLDLELFYAKHRLARIADLPSGETPL
jgi:hypothetical protein